MAARAAVQAVLDASVQSPSGKLHLLGFQGVYAGNSVDTPPEDMFIIVRWDEDLQAFSRRSKQTMTVWLHSRDPDYTQIDAGLEAVKDLIEPLVHRYGADGWILTQADWRGDSGDLYDDGYRTVTKNSSFEVVSRYSPIQI